jgi:hypothetical protein
VWKRQPEFIELPVLDGWEIQDDNLLACSREHIMEVFAMLARQPHRARFTGGIEAKLLNEWHVALLRKLRPAQIFFTYDMADDLPPLIRAAEMLTPYFNRHVLYCYVLIGYPGDTMEAADLRLQQVKDLGLCPFAMLYRDDLGQVEREWVKFQRQWCRPWHYLCSPAAVCGPGRRPSSFPLCGSSRDK